MLTDREKQKILGYLQQFAGREGEVRLMLKSGKWSSADENAFIHEWLERRERAKEYIKQRRMFVISIVAMLAAVISAVAALVGANQQKLQTRAQLNPYVLIKPAQNVLQLKDQNVVVLPYRLENVGSTPALEIKKGYTSYLVDSSGKEKLIQAYKEPEDKTDALLPSQTSAVHVDNINISGFNPSDLSSKIRVDLEVTYKGFSEVDSRVAYSRARLVLLPGKTKEGQIVFYVSQPFLDFGFK